MCVCCTPTLTPSLLISTPQIPTITCTSSNVLQTVLQAFAQVDSLWKTHRFAERARLTHHQPPPPPKKVPGLHVWYGPDTYMGENLHTLLSRLAGMTDEQVAAVHPQHTAATIRDLLPRFQYFKQVGE